MVDRRKPQLDELLKAGAEGLAKDVTDVEGLSDEEYLAKKRQIDLDGSKHWSKRVKPCLNWLFLIFLAMLLLGLAVMCGAWLWANFDNPDNIRDAFKSLLDLGMVGGSFLYIESKWSASRSGR